MSDNTADQIITLGEKHFIMFHDSEGRSYCVVRYGKNAGTVFAADGERCRRYLTLLYYRKTGDVPSESKVRDAALTLAAIGLYEGNCHERHCART